MNTAIASLTAWEILDSRGKPTVAARCVLAGGAEAVAHAPSGASTGIHEAHELRDRDPARHAGHGVLLAVEHVNRDIARALAGRDASNQAAIDGIMIDLDGTADKSRLGANAILAVSCAVARAAARAEGVPLFRWLAGDRRPSMPVPMVNILSGNKHTIGGTEFQDFLAMPSQPMRFAEAMDAICAVHREARHLILERGLALTGVADEGGWGPSFASNEAALELLSEAIARTGKPLAIALDVAATHFFSEGSYRLEGHAWTSARHVDYLADLAVRFPVISIEDGCAEDDWAGWQMLTRRLGARCQLIGDDLFTTNLERVNRGIREGCANAVLVKMNQIGTLTETFAVIDRAREAGFRAVISARSGETEDDFLADLAVASGAGQIKVGSITRSERLAKYNRLLELEAAGALGE
jgi:enolase